MNGTKLKVPDTLLFSYTDLCFICALTNLIAGISGYVVCNFQHEVLYRLRTTIGTNTNTEPVR